MHQMSRGEPTINAAPASHAFPSRNDAWTIAQRLARFRDVKSERVAASDQIPKVSSGLDVGRNIFGMLARLDELVKRD